MSQWIVRASGPWWSYVLKILYPAAFPLFLPSLERGVPPDFWFYHKNSNWRVWEWSSYWDVNSTTPKTSNLGISFTWNLKKGQEIPLIFASPCNPLNLYQEEAKRWWQKEQAASHPFWPGTTLFMWMSSPHSPSLFHVKQGTRLLLFSVSNPP